jgi:hypothetical protein
VSWLTAPRYTISKRKYIKSTNVVIHINQLRQCVREHTRFLVIYKYIKVIKTNGEINIPERFD